MVLYHQQVFGVIEPGLMFQCFSINLTAVFQANQTRGASNNLHQEEPDRDSIITKQLEQ